VVHWARHISPVHRERDRLRARLRVMFAAGYAEALAKQLGI
jgi:hypothetical protein